MHVFFLHLMGFVSSMAKVRGVRHADHHLGATRSRRVKGVLILSGTMGVVTGILNISLVYAPRYDESFMVGYAAAFTILSLLPIPILGMYLLPKYLRVIIADVDEAIERMKGRSPAAGEHAASTEVLESLRYDLKNYADSQRATTVAVLIPGFIFGSPIAFRLCAYYLSCVWISANACLALAVWTTTRHRSSKTSAASSAATGKETGSSTANSTSVSPFAGARQPSHGDDEEDVGGDN